MFSASRLPRGPDSPTLPRPLCSASAHLPTHISPQPHHLHTASVTSLQFHAEARFSLISRFLVMLFITGCTALTPCSFSILSPSTNMLSHYYICQSFLNSPNYRLVTPKCLSLLTNCTVPSL